MTLIAHSQIRPLILGHTGFLGRTVKKRIEDSGVECIGASLSSGVDIRIKDSLDQIVDENRIDTIINCAAVVGGIEFGRNHQINMFTDNLEMTLTILKVAAQYNLKVVNPISNCVYPSRAKVFRESEFWDGPLDDSVRTYGAVRKVAYIGALAFAEQVNLRSVNLIFPNLYGPGDHLDPIRAHALGALVFKMVTAHKLKNPKVTVWGSGEPIREWMFVEDAAEAIYMSLFSSLGPELLNIGTGVGYSIKEIVGFIIEEVGYKGSVHYDLSKRDGAPHKTMDGTRGAELIGWRPKVSIREGIKKTVEWYQSSMT